MEFIRLQCPETRLYFNANPVEEVTLILWDIEDWCSLRYHCPHCQSIELQSFNDEEISKEISDAGVQIQFIDMPTKDMLDDREITPDEIIDLAKGLGEIVFADEIYT